MSAFMTVWGLAQYIRLSRPEVLDGSVSLCSEEDGTLAQFFYGELVPTVDRTKPCWQKLEEDFGFSNKMVDWVESEILRISRIPKPVST